MEPEKMKCILLTLRTENIVLPNAAVAEIVSVREIQKVSGAPRWLIGKMMWRDVEIPLVSFEAAAEGQVTIMGVNQAAVIHLIDKDEDSPYPYVGLAISGVPHISYFTQKQMTTDTRSAKVHPMVAQRIRINGAATSILDIESISAMIKQAAV